MPLNDSFQLTRKMKSFETSTKIPLISFLQWDFQEAQKKRFFFSFTIFRRWKNYLIEFFQNLDFKIWNEWPSRVSTYSNWMNLPFYGFCPLVLSIIVCEDIFCVTTFEITYIRAIPSILISMNIFHEKSVVYRTKWPHSFYSLQNST